MSKILLIALLIMAICSTIATLAAIGFVLYLVSKRDNAKKMDSTQFPASNNTPIYTPREDAKQQKTNISIAKPSAKGVLAHEDEISHNPTQGNAECDHDNSDLFELCDPTMSQEQTEVVTIDSSVELDPMLQQAVDIILTQNHASPDVLQKQLGIGYSRAALLLDQMESIGIIGPFTGANPREILVSNVSWEYVQPQHINSKDSLPTGNYTYSEFHGYRPPTKISRGNIAILSEEEMHVLQLHYYKADEIRTKVKGVTFRNDDGTDRQSILAHCHAGDQLRFEKYDYNGVPAYAVYCDWGQIGNLSAELAEEIAAREKPCIILGEILNVSGGYQGDYFGCNISLTIYEKHYTAADTPAENAISAAAVTDITTEDDDSQPTDPFECIRDSKNMAHYIVLDIETTGFSHDNDKVIEIAAIHYVFGVEAERFHTYINPQMPIPKHITRLTGIRQADVDTAPLLDDIADDFRAFIKDYPLVGHNIIDFDLPFLVSHINLDEPRLVIDTLDMSRFTFPLLPSHKLSNLNYWFDLDDGISHHADADASATNALMWACLYPDKYEGLYRKAIRDGLPESKHTHEPKPHHHFHHISTSEIKPSSCHDTTSGPLTGKKIVFTGDLSIPRKDAMQMAVDAGAILRSSVSSKTDFLIVGEQDITVVGSDGMSTKQEKANELNSSGKANIQIINEQEFLTMIGQQTATV